MNPDNIVGIRLAEIRAQAGYSQVDLAKFINVSPSTVAMWETGKREIKASTLLKLSEVFGVSTDYLIGRNDNPLLPINEINSNKANIRFISYGNESDKLNEDEAEFIKESLKVFRTLELKSARKKKNVKQ